MKLLAKSRTLLTTASLGLALFAGSASAEYRVTAFGYSNAYDALLSKDVASAKSSIYSNLAVARAMSGDMMGASGDLESALLLNARDRNAVSNYTLIHDLATVAEVAQSL